MGRTTNYTPTTADITYPPSQTAISPTALDVPANLNCVLYNDPTGTLGWKAVNTNNSVLFLDVNGLISPQFLPSYISSVRDYVNVAAFPTVGVDGIIYVDMSGTTASYRWSGTAYTLINDFTDYYTKQQSDLLYTPASSCYTTGQSDATFATLTQLATYSTTSATNTYIAGQLSSYSNTTAVNGLIATALTNVDTISQTNAAISSAISSALTPYSTTSQTSTAISTALCNYDTIAQTNTAIASAVSNYYTKTQTDAAYATVSSAYTKAQSDALYTPVGTSYTKAQDDSNVASAIAPLLTTSAYNTNIANYSTTSQMNTAISSALVPYSTSTQVTNAISNAVAPLLPTATFTSTISSYSTTSQMNGAIATALVPYSTTTQVTSAIGTATSPLLPTATYNSSIANYSTTSQMNTAISTALVPYSTTTLMNSAIATAIAPYSTTSQMNTAISTALTPYSTTTLMNSAIASAIAPYSTTTQMNSAISTALTPYSTTSQMNAILVAGYVQLANPVLSQISYGGNVIQTFTSGYPTMNTQLNMNSQNVVGCATVGAATYTYTAGIKGLTTGTASAAGNLGEIIQNNASLTVTTATLTNVTSISLTAGNWRISGNIYLINGTGAFVSAIQGGLNTTSATLPTSVFQQMNFSGTSLTTYGSPTPLLLLSVSATTTVYLVVKATFAFGTTTCQGNIVAQRSY
jgi:hypothetical protein